MSNYAGAWGQLPQPPEANGVSGAEYFLADFGINFCFKTLFRWLKRVLMRLQGLRPGVLAPT